MEGKLPATCGLPRADLYRRIGVQAPPGLGPYTVRGRIFHCTTRFNAAKSTGTDIAHTVLTTSAASAFTHKQMPQRISSEIRNVRP